MPLFERRHYDWLAHWAGQNIGPKAAASLAIALAADNPRFSPEHFGDAYLARRKLAQQETTLALMERLRKANFPNTLAKE